MLVLACARAYMYIFKFFFISLTFYHTEKKGITIKKVLIGTCKHKY